MVARPQPHGIAGLALGVGCFIQHQLTAPQREQAVVGAALTGYQAVIHRIGFPIRIQHREVGNGGACGEPLGHGGGAQLKIGGGTIQRWRRSDAVAGIPLQGEFQAFISLQQGVIPWLDGHIQAGGSGWNDKALGSPRHGTDHIIRTDGTRDRHRHRQRAAEVATAGQPELQRNGPVFPHCRWTGALQRYGIQDAVGGGVHIVEGIPLQAQAQHPGKHGDRFIGTFDPGWRPGTHQDSGVSILNLQAILRAVTPQLKAINQRVEIRHLEIVKSTCAWRPIVVSQSICGGQHNVVNVIIAIHHVNFAAARIQGEGIERKDEIIPQTSGNRVVAAP